MQKSLNKWEHFQETGQLEHGGGNLNKRKRGNQHGGGKHKHGRNKDDKDPKEMINHQDGIAKIVV